jgi:predicted ATP-grasp superfamily ATP-dependent carboligase
MCAPDSDEEPDALCEFLVGLGSAITGKAVLFATRDADVHFLNRYRSRLEVSYVVGQPGDESLDVIMNKRRLAQVAEECGVGIPRTLEVDSPAALESRRHEVRYPAVIKPVYSSHWRASGIWQAVGARKGFKVRNWSECRDTYKRIGPHQPLALIQEWVPGPEEAHHVMGAYIGRNGDCLGAFTAQKILQYPAGFGLGCLLRLTQRPDVVELGLSVLRQAGYRGIAEVEFKQDERSGLMCLIEVNPRHWDQHGLGNACEVNLSHMMYRDLCGEDVPAARLVNEVRACWISLSGLTGALKEAIETRNWSTFKHLSLPLTAKKCYAMWDWRDPMPFLRIVRPISG